MAHSGCAVKGEETSLRKVTCHRRKRHYEQAHVRTTLICGKEILLKGKQRGKGRDGSGVVRMGKRAQALPHQDPIPETHSSLLFLGYETEHWSMLTSW